MESVEKVTVSLSIKYKSAVLYSNNTLISIIIDEDITELLPKLFNAVKDGVILYFVRLSTNEYKICAETANIS